MYHKYQVVPNEGYGKGNFRDDSKVSVVHPSYSWGLQTGFSLPLVLTVLFHTSMCELCSGGQNLQKIQKLRHQDGFF